MADCNKAVELDPKLAQPYFYIGFAYKMTGDYHKAISNFKQAANIFSEKGQFKEAAKSQSYAVMDILKMNTSGKYDEELEKAEKFLNCYKAGETREQCEQLSE